MSFPGVRNEGTSSPSKSNPRFQGAVDAEFRNNVVYDWDRVAAYGEFDRLNYVGNYLKPGPSATQRPQLFLEGTESIAGASLYFTDNVLEGNGRATEDNWRASGFYYDHATLAAAAPFPAPPVTTTERAAAAYEHVLEKAGATSPTRDAVGTRIAREVRTGTGHIIDSVDAVGGCVHSGISSGVEEETPSFRIMVFPALRENPLVASQLYCLRIGVLPATPPAVMGRL
jgi:hypothetical protein